MPQINATVYWDEEHNKGKVRPHHIKVPASNGATVIQWTCDPEIATFGISGLAAGEFTRTSGNGRQGTPVTTTDQNNNTTVYTYTVTATHTDGRTSSHDPKIENGT